MTSGRPKRRVLVLTGAGASVHLGANGQPLPLMPDWASSLVDALGPHAEQLKVRRDMPGDEFERALGRFLAFERSLPIVGEFGYMGTQGHPQLGVDGNFQAWYNAANQNVAAIRLGIWQNLWQSFGRNRVDDAAATAAYAGLHELIRSADQPGEAESYLAHVTTNYDTAIETALAADPGLIVRDGFVARPGGGTAIYTPETLTSSMDDATNIVPVIHLHGAVGWYYRDEDIVRLPADEDYDERRPPALLLPDDSKGPSSFTAAHTATWQQFLRLLSASTHVVFLGHSLHDAHIVQAVIDRNAPTVAVLHTSPDAKGNYPKPDPDKAKWYVGQIPGIVTLAGEFGKTAGVDGVDRGPLVTWLRDTSPTGP